MPQIFPAPDLGVKKKVTHHPNELTEKEKMCVHGREIKLKRVKDNVIQSGCLSAKKANTKCSEYDV